MDVNFKQLTTSQFYLHLPDSTIWQYKGITYGWSRVAKYKDVLNLSVIVGQKLDLAGGKMTGDISYIDGSMSGNINPNSGNGLLFRKNSDYGKVYFESTGNSTGDSNLVFENGDDLTAEGGTTEGFLFTKYNYLTASRSVLARINPTQFKYNNFDVFHSGNLLNLNQLSIRSFNDLQDKPDLSVYQLRSEKGNSNGYASLDVNGKVPLIQINDALLGAVNYRGNYDASNNTPALPTPASSNKGYYWIVSVAGTQQGLSLRPGDWIISNGTTYGRVASSADVESVAGRKGVVVLTKNDVGLNNVDNTSDANKPVSTPQSIALNAKLNLSGGTLTGAVQSPISPVIGNDLTNKTYVDGLISTTVAGYAKIDGSNATGTWNNSANSLKSYKNSSTVFLGWDGLLNLKIDGTDYGKSFPIDITGVSNNSILLNGYAPSMANTNNTIAQRDEFGRLSADRLQYGNLSSDDGPLTTLMGMSSPDKTIYRFTLPTVISALGIDTKASTSYVDIQLLNKAGFNGNTFNGNQTVNANITANSILSKGSVQVINNNRIYSVLNWSNVGSITRGELSLQRITNSTGDLISLSTLTPSEATGTFQNSMPAGSGALVASLTATASLDFPNTAAGQSSDLTFTIVGAVLGDNVIVNPPVGSVMPNSTYTCWVSATDTVTIRFLVADTISPKDPPAGIFKIRVLK